MHNGRLSTLRAAFVVARRDFVAILFSRSFLFFLLGPLFPLIVGGLAGGIGQKVQENADRPVLGIAMTAADVRALHGAYDRLAPQIGSALPEIAVVRELAPGQAFDPAAEMRSNRANLGAILSGSLAHPVLTGPPERIAEWKGRVALLGSAAQSAAPAAAPEVETRALAVSRADQTHGRLVTAQLGQTVLFLLTMLLAGMVLSNLVEEKGNKIIEVLAAAIPMDAVFLGKLFAMLAVSWVGITVWGGVGGIVWLGAGHSLGDYPAPAVGWGAFLGLGVVYFSMGYLLLGSLFLAIGSMASTVREVQTLSMPVTMLQLLNFFFASYAVSQPGSVVELAAIAVPFSSPFAMLARAAQQGAIWPHLAAIAWQAVCVAVFVRVGASVFRKRVMKSGSAGGSKRRRWLRRSAAA